MLRSSLLFLITMNHVVRSMSFLYMSCYHCKPCYLFPFCLFHLSYRPAGLAPPLGHLTRKNTLSGHLLAVLTIFLAHSFWFLSGAGPEDPALLGAASSHAAPPGAGSQRKPRMVSMCVCMCMCVCKCVCKRVCVCACVLCARLVCAPLQLLVPFFGSLNCQVFVNNA
jgi:hypothetical protein